MGRLRPRPRPGRPRSLAGRVWWPWRPTVLLALLGLAGALATLVPPAPPPPVGPPLRYVAGPPLTARLVILFAPQLDDRALTALSDALHPDPATGVTHFAVPRPEYASFPEATVLLLAGNARAATAPSASLSQPSDTLVRAATDRGLAVALVGPPAWRALFGVGATPPEGTPVPTPAGHLAELGHALRAGPALTIGYLDNVTAREIASDLRDDLASLGEALDARDTLLLVGGAGIGAPFAAMLRGPTILSGLPRTVPLNDVAPTCAVLLGAPYPYEARGRIAWSLLAVDDRHKATATATLARQRTTLAARAVPFGALYPTLLKTALGRLPTIEALLQNGEPLYSYQLAASAVDEADRALDEPSTIVLTPSRRASWPLVALCLAAALLAPAFAAVYRAPRSLVAAVLGLIVGTGAWLGLLGALRGAVVTTLPTVGGLLLAPALCAGGFGLWISQGRRTARAVAVARGWLTVELLVLLAALPAAACAYRYGQPWQLRLDEAAPLFYWRSALLAPTFLLLAGSSCVFWLPRIRRSRTPATPVS